MKHLAPMLTTALALVAAPFAHADEKADLTRATFAEGALPSGQSALTLAVQVRLDRVGFSPGVIDGYSGQNVVHALEDFQASRGLTATGELDAETWKALGPDAKDVVTRYEITAQDLDKLVDEIPDNVAVKAEMAWLGFTSGAEAMAETFHMDADLLRQLNPDAAFEPGETIVVAAVEDVDADAVAEIRVDAARHRLIALNDKGDVVATYPASIGSDDTPSPSGDYTVEAIAIEPTYSYNPEINFVADGVTDKLILAPGPNSPVGIAWIDLSEPTYGIHGTDEPATVGRAVSHGCVRLTNWDATELAHNVSPGVKVAFAAEGS